jgi:2-dehydro-3-deoxyphosphooctonate aldolase (KDO 8-P synthase)
VRWLFRRDAEGCQLLVGEVGVAGFFIECHPDPDNAPSDGPNVIPLDRMEGLLAMLAETDRTAKSHPFSLA